MASYNYGKTEVVNYIADYAKKSKKVIFSVLDVGSCDGKWSDLLTSEFKKDNMPTLLIDGCEKFKPNAAKCLHKYNAMFVGDILDYSYRNRQYDLILFGDVIEHMYVDEAQYVLKYALSHAKEVIVGVPYKYHQGEIYGNPFEKHIQDDLTHELFMERYEGLERFLNPVPDYGYYRKAKK